MLITIISIYTLYVLVSMYTSVMQIGYINMAKRKRAVLLDADKFLTAGNYAVAKEKLNLVSTFFDYIVFVTWIGVGISLLQQNIFLENDAIQNVSIVMSFLIIGSIISLPFSYYEKFVLDEAFGFNKSSLGLWIKDTLISFAMTLVFGS